MSSAVPGTDQALRGLANIHARVSRFHAQHAFYRGLPVLYTNDEPVGVNLASKAFRDRIFMGGYGCGKSYVLDLTLLTLCALQPNNLGLVLRKQFEQLKNTTLATFWEIVEEATDGDRNRLICDVDEKNGPIEVYIRTSGVPSKLIFRIEPDGTTESVRDSLKGYELGCFGMDEMTQLKKISYDTLKNRLRRPGFQLAGLGASNPAREAHWLTQLVQKAEHAAAIGDEPNELIIRARSFDNPFIRADYIEDLKKQYRDDPDGYDMYILGKDGMDVAGKPVFRRDFNAKVHLDDKVKFDPTLPLYAGLDFGYHHPSAIWFQRDRFDRYNVLAELNPEDIGVDAFADLVLEFNGRHFPMAKDMRYYGDPAGAQASDKGDPTIQRLARKGIQVGYMSSEINPGIEVIRQLLTKMVDGRPRIVFHPRCKRLIDAFRGGYYYKETRDGSVGDKPYKDGVYDHPVDALRYGLINLVLKQPHQQKLPAYAEGNTRIRLV